MALFFTTTRNLNKYSPSSHLSFEHLLTTHLPDMPKAETKPRANTKKAAGKAKKDENAPKRALSAYMYMSQEFRPKVREEHPEASFGEIGKILGAKWKEMPTEEKKPFEDQAAADKARYEKEKKEYDATKDEKKDEDSEENGDKEEKEKPKKEKKEKKKPKKEVEEKEEKEASGGDDDEDEQ
ncbi:hypothetical protein E3P99_01903 [Wallemia hederae]|uniref:HMG box domain-containing protein n=1 Tax=Wallemia hederae TaxID=1540922 RepID=A0A4T0FMP0_9BASI|nr:hypothetical protein E3P99_01903 [Wallemia hederae]